VRSLLPGSSPKQYVPLTEIQGLRDVSLRNLTPEVKEKVRLLELGKLPTPMLKITSDYFLVDEAENIEAWLVCRVAQISAVGVLLVNGPPLDRGRPQVIRPVYLDENQLDLTPEMQEVLSGHARDAQEQEEQDAELGLDEEEDIYPEEEEEPYEPPVDDEPL
jgi:hypothetical protein